MIDRGCVRRERPSRGVWMAAMFAAVGVVMSVTGIGCRSGGGLAVSEPAARLLLVDDLTGEPATGAQVIVTEADPRHPLKVWDYLRGPRDGRVIVPTNSVGEAAIPAFEGVSGGQQVLVVGPGWVPRALEWTSVRESAWRGEPVRVGLRRVAGAESEKSR